MDKLLLGLSLGFAALILNTPAEAQQSRCAERQKVLDQITEKYGESRRGMGLAQNQGIVEMYASDETGTWTILLTLPNGMTCLVASGSDYAELDAPQGIAM